MPIAHRLAAGLISLAGVMMVAVPPPAEAQLAATPQLTLLLPNYEGGLVGETEALESGALAARASGAVATFYNPAGLALVETSQLVAGSSSFEWVRYSVASGNVDAGRRSSRTRGGIFGVALGDPPFRSKRWRLGFLVATPVSWQPALEAQTRGPVPQGNEALSFVSINSVSDLSATLAAACRVTPSLRVGASAGLSYFSIYQNRSTFSDLVTASDIQSSEATVFSDGSTSSLMFGGGLQWDVSPRVRVGVAAAAPNIRLGGASSLIYRGAERYGAAARLATFEDDRAGFRYRQPFRLSAGVAWLHRRGGLEFDVRWHAPTGTYAVYSSRQVASLVESDASGTIQTTPPFPDQMYTSRTVANVAVGGRFKLADALTIHGGFYTDRSPVADGPQPVFFQLNVVGATAGASIRFKGLSGSVGMRYLSGQSSPEIVTQSNAPYRPEIGLSSVGLMFALSYTF